MMLGACINLSSCSSHAKKYDDSVKASPIIMMDDDPAAVAAAEEDSYVAMESSSPPLPPKDHHITSLKSLSHQLRGLLSLGGGVSKKSPSHSHMNGDADDEMRCIMDRRHMAPSDEFGHYHFQQLQSHNKCFSSATTTIRSFAPARCYRNNSDVAAAATPTEGEEVERGQDPYWKSGGVFAEDEEEEEEAAAAKTAAEMAGGDDGGDWVAQVETGVFLSLRSLGDGRNELRRLRFSCKMFDKYEAQQWWANNCEMVHELYNIPKNRRRIFGTLPLTSHFKGEDYISQSNNVKVYPQGVNESTNIENLSKRMLNALCMHNQVQSCEGSFVSSPMCNPMDTNVLKPYNITKVNVNSMENDHTSSLYEVHEDQPGVYICIASSSTGLKELKRLRFSHEMFNEAQAQLWWEENRVRIHRQYL